MLSLIVTAEPGTFAAEILALRQEQGLTQEEAAVKAGVPLRSWQSYERGETEPRASRAAEIRQRFGVNGDKSPATIGAVEPRTPFDIDAEAEPPGRYSHLVQAGATWDYELTDPESGTVRAAVQIRFMVAPDVRRRSLSSAPAGGASADPSQARSAS